MEGTTVGAGNDVAIAPSCASNDHKGPGVWYKAIGDGSRFNVETCSPDTEFDTILSIFTGIGCSDLVCVASNDDHPLLGADSCASSVLHSTVSWDTVVGQSYYIHVHGYAGSSGPFRLDLTTDVADPETDGPMPMPTPPPSTSSPPPASVVPNDFCSTAASIGFVPVRNGTTVNATDDFSMLPACYSFSGPGVWYETKGDGTTFLASTCSPRTDFDTTIAVFSGSCSNLTCVASNDDILDSDTCGFSLLHSAVMWNTTALETYYIFVRGFVGSTGIFDLDIASVDIGGVVLEPNGV